MKRLKHYLTAAVAILLSAAILSGTGLPAFAKDGGIETLCSITALTQSGVDGNKITASVLVTDLHGNPVSEETEQRNIAFYTGGSKTTAVLSADGTQELTRTVSKGTIDVYAVYTGYGDYASSESEHITLNVLKPALTVSASPSRAGKSTGSITVDSEYGSYEYYKSPGGAAKTVNGGVISGLDAGTYYVKGLPFQTGNNVYLASANTRVVIEETEEILRSVTLTGEHAVWFDADRDRIGTAVELPEDSEDLLYVKAEAGYAVVSVAAEPEDAAGLAFDPKTGALTISNVTADFSLAAIAEDIREESVVTVSVSQSPQNGNVLVAYVAVTDKNGSPVDAGGTVTLYAGSGSVSGETDETGGRTFSKSLRVGESQVYAVYSGSETYRPSESGRITVAVVEAALSADQVSADPSYKNRASGRITVAADYSCFAYYALPGGDTIRVSGNTAKGLPAGEYYVYIPDHSENNVFYLSSNRVPVTVDAVPEFYYTVSTAGEHALWGDSAVTVPEGEGAQLSLAAEDGYIITGVTAEPAGNADVRYDPAAGLVTVENVAGSVTLSAGYRYEADENDAYAVTLTPDPRIQWKTPGDQIKIKYGSTGSVYAISVDEDRYYIESVSASPAGRARVSLSATGEILIEDLISDIVLTLNVVEKRSVEGLAVDYEFVTGGNYSETSPAVAAVFRVRALDAEGTGVPGVKIWFKSDESDPSYSLIRETGADGTAQIRYVYSIEDGADRADFRSLFSLNGGFENAAAQELHFVKQKNSDLVLYKNQIIAATPDAADGKVIGAPENYEFYDGEIHQGAIVSGGSWIRPVNGEIAGLSAGQHALRAAEYADHAADTFYLKSDYAVFTVPRGIWTVAADAEGSPNVNFPQGTTFTAEPGGTVYVWATAEEGYEITGYSVDKPAFVSGSLAYDEENGYIAIEGVTGSLTLRVTASPLPTEPEPAEKTDPAPDPEPETGTTTKPDAPTTADGDARKEPAARQTDSEGTAKKTSLLEAILEFILQTILFLKSVYRALGV